MSYNDIPELPLEPPESKRARVYTCVLCEEGILEGDDYYDIPDLGYCCKPCIDRAKCYSAEPEYPEWEED